MSIEVHDITKVYGTQKALNNISFTIKTGEIVGFLGPNGAGKSTMMKILTGFIPQTSGTAMVAGNDVNQNQLAVKARVGYLPENNPLYTDMYIREYLAFVAGTYGVNKARVDELIELTGLSPERQKKINHLSKGYRQRVGLAAALIHDPEVLILDEPTTGLDPNQLVEIRNLIKEVGKQKTVMLSTHIMQEVEQLCDRVIILNKGEIVADEPIATLQNAASQKELFVSFDAPVSVNELKKLPEVLRVKAVEGNSFELIVRDADTVRKAVFDLAVEKKTSIREIREKAQNLENIFQKLTK